MASSSKATGQHWWLGWYALAYVPDELQEEEGEKLKPTMTKLTEDGDIIYNIFQGDMNGDVIGVASGYEVFHCDWFIILEPVDYFLCENRLLRQNGMDKIRHAQPELLLHFGRENALGALHDLAQFALVVRPLHFHQVGICKVEHESHVAQCAGRKFNTRAFALRSKDLLQQGEALGRCQLCDDLSFHDSLFFIA